VVVVVVVAIMIVKMKFNGGCGCSGCCCVVIIIVMMQSMALVDYECKWNTPQLMASNGNILHSLTQTDVKALLEINFIYLGIKEIYCILKTCYIVSVLFSTKCHLFHSFICVVLPVLLWQENNGVKLPIK
jgi:hypothetical protein